jgi:hypothetical protein
MNLEIIALGFVLGLIFVLLLGGSDNGDYRRPKNKEE